MTELSKGHIGWTPDGRYQWYQTPDGNVHKAHHTVVNNCRTGYAQGRFEGTRAWFDSMRELGMIVLAEDVDTQESTITVNVQPRGMFQF